MAARTNKPNHNEKTKDNIKATQLINLLTEHAITGAYNGQPVDQARIAAARAALPFLRPTLQAVQQSVEDPWSGKTEQDLLDSVRALITARPELLAGVKHLVEPAKAVGSALEGANTVASTQQKTA